VGLSPLAGLHAWELLINYVISFFFICADTLAWIVNGEI